MHGSTFDLDMIEEIKALSSFVAFAENKAKTIPIFVSDFNIKALSLTIHWSS